MPRHRRRLAGAEGQGQIREKGECLTKGQCFPLRGCWQQHSLPCLQYLTISKKADFWFNGLYHNRKDVSKKTEICFFKCMEQVCQMHILLTAQNQRNNEMVVDGRPMACARHEKWLIAQWQVIVRWRLCSATGVTAPSTASWLALFRVDCSVFLSLILGRSHVGRKDPATW